MIDFRIQTFLAVCRQKSFSKAADNLHITQPAVSQHIKYLETEFGQPLFRVKGKGFKLSPAGVRLLRYAETVESDTKCIKEQIMHEREDIPFRFGATKTIGEYILPGCISAFLSENAQTTLTMAVDNSANLIVALRNGDLDFVFIEGVFNRNEFHTELFFSDAFIPVCAATDASANGVHTLDELFLRTLIVREKGSGSRLILENALAARNYTISDFGRSIEIGSIGAIKSLVASGAGIAFLYEQSVRQEMSDRHLARIPLSDFAVQHDYSFICLRDSIHADRYLDFLSFCREHRNSIA